MSSLTNAYKTVLDDLRRRRDRIDSVIKTLSSLAEENPKQEEMTFSALPSLNHIVAEAANQDHESRFSKMTIIVAALNILSEAGEPLSVSEITKRMEEGGRQLNSIDKPRMVGNMLMRSRDRHGFFENPARGLWAISLRGLEHILELGASRR